MIVPVSLAVPLLGAPLHNEESQPGTNAQTPELHEGPSGVASDTQSHQNSLLPSITSITPDPSIYSMPEQSLLPAVSLNRTVIPITPGEIRRYDRTRTIQARNTVFKIEKGPLDCSDEVALVEGWEPLTHPSGALFFYHPERRVFTDANVRDPRIRVKIDNAAVKAYEEARNANIVLHPSVELGLELIEHDQKIGYYFVDHDRRVIFWYEDRESHHLILGVRGVESKSHIKYVLESQYWFVRPYKYTCSLTSPKIHIELFPNKCSLPEDVVGRLRELLMHSQAEFIISGASLSPFASDEMLRLIDPVISSADEKHEHVVDIIARCMNLFCEVKYLSYCGQPGIRLNTNELLYGDSNTRSKTILFRLMDITMFGSLSAHHKALHGISVDNTIIQLGRYRNFIDRLICEWTGYTVFLSRGSNPSIVLLYKLSSAPVIASYLSTFCAMGSLMVTLVFTRQVNDDRRYPNKRMASFMFGICSTGRLALMLSMPFALLMWGVLSFTTALSILVFHTSDVYTLSIAYPDFRYHSYHDDMACTAWLL
ncbi:hypothetical protein DFH29DRAFT_993306 [Suillus ampliporus]|nr:hypothetical protein DFH29DRAFT_993306 [Suillus ampliporus]